MNETSIIQKLGDLHLLGEKSRWEEAIECARALFVDPEQARLATLFLSATELTRYYLFGANNKKLNGLFGERICTGSTCELLEMMHSFISYHLLDDGDPGLAYMATNEYGEWVQCESDELDAMPYFHRCVEEQREIYPDAKLLMTDSAVEAFEWYEKRRLKALKELTNLSSKFSGLDGSWKLTDLAEAYKLTPREIELGNLAKELSAQ